MPVIQYEVYINAPPEVCYDLARDVETHTKTTAKTKERPVGDVTSGLLDLGDTVTWEAVHLGVKQRLTAKITEAERPYRFTDEMVKGAFHSFTHTHEFIKSGSGTLMKDTFDYKSPFGVIGNLADKLFLEKYMRDFIITRADKLKEIAEEMNIGL
ncbi:SRPBCC family protein [Metabacillus fastidiosus]|uniref:SRPBCC family protein n=1 Tax=Metabacillus fastidiosus TaxID=1458 RepID=UPI000824DD32|nr:SRPBCC family protein [Metabacillus fastidiosus]MED4463209.1 SRPBCC family protein [Metabacillus fastidiosus]